MGEFKSKATTTAGFIKDVSLNLMVEGGIAGAKIGEMAFVGKQGVVVGGVVGGIMGLQAGIGLSLSILISNNGKVPGDPNYDPNNPPDNPYTPPPGMPNSDPNDPNKPKEPILPNPPSKKPFRPPYPWDKDLPPDPPVDPLVLDLDGDGIKTIAIDNNRYFDADGDGFATSTAWINGKDGFLVIDRNGDGTINNGTELFGDQTILQNGKKAQNGFEALKELDENRDGKIDEKDSAWKSLNVWIDGNSNGITDEGELHTLEEVNVKSLFTGCQRTDITDENNNLKNAAGSYKTADGAIREMNNYLFESNVVNSQYQEDVPLDIEEVINFAYMPGKGTVMDSWQAVTTDETGQLKSLMEQFAAEKDPELRDKFMDEILFKWTGSEGVAEDSRGKYFNAKELSVLEKFYGRIFSSNGAGDNVLKEIAQEMHGMYGNVKQYYMGWMMAQTHLDQLFGEIIINVAGENNDQIVLDFSAVKTYIQAALEQDFAAGKTLLGQFANTAWAMELNTGDSYSQFCDFFINQGESLAFEIYAAGRNRLEGTAGNDELTSEDGASIVYGGSGNDTIRAAGDDVVLFGGEGGDKLYGNNGNDTLEGGLGNDYLEGWYGDDTYIWGKGQGNDTISNAVLKYGTPVEGGTDILKLSEGLKPEDIAWSKNGNNLIATIKETGETLTFTDWYWNTLNSVDKIEFADGSILTPAQIDEMTKVMNGTEANDKLTGGDTSDRFNPVKMEYCL